VIAETRRECKPADRQRYTHSEDDP
jgi:hypothetical protein